MTRSMRSQRGQSSVIAALPGVVIAVDLNASAKVAGRLWCPPRRISPAGPAGETPAPQAFYVAT
jgi:hypothetical protein